MEVHVLKGAEAIAQAAGELFCETVRQKPGAVLGLATGATPAPTYRYMAAQCKAGRVSFRGVKTFNLDEYCDLPVEHPESYRSYMDAQLFGQIDIPPQNTHLMDGNAADPAAEARRFEEEIAAAGGIDLQLLGIGRNGHIGFNEPGDAFTQDSFKVELTPSTIEANSVYFTEELPMPRHAMTMGIGTILRARKIVLIATGESKAEAVRAMLEGELTPRCPASALQKHPDVTVYLDPAAAALLRGMR
jgi:glucosamine-6-phosphate deaminase